MGSVLNVVLQRQGSDEPDITETDGNMASNIPASGSTGPFQPHLRQQPAVGMSTSRPECYPGEEMTMDVAVPSQTNTRHGATYRHHSGPMADGMTLSDSTLNMVRHHPLLSQTAEQCRILSARAYETKRKVDMLDCYVRHEKQKLDDEVLSLREESAKRDQKMEEELREKERQMNERADARNAEVQKLAATLEKERQRKLDEIRARERAADNELKLVQEKAEMSKARQELEQRRREEEWERQKLAEVQRLNDLQRQLENTKCELQGT
jgi:hypothetical protein